MKKSPGGRFADTMIVKPSSWHGRAYQFWQRHGGIKNNPGYRENLCHYSRVVLIWAPLAIIKVMIQRFAEFAGPTAGKIGGYIDRHGGAMFGRWIDKLTLWYCKYVLRGKQVKLQKLGWGERIGSLIVIVLTAWSLMAGLIFLLLHPLQALMAYAVLAAGVAVLLGGIWAGFSIADSIGGKEHQKTTPIRDTIQLAGHVIVAKKRGICPFIEFEAPDPPQTKKQPVVTVMEEAPPIIESIEEVEEPILVPA